MATYSFKGLNKQGKEIKSSVTCDSIAGAKVKIKSQGIMLISIKEQKAKTEDKGVNLTAFSKAVPVHDLALMTRQLATLIKAKIQIVQALQALSEQMENPTLKLALNEIKQDVNEGTSLANALKKHSAVFDNIYINMVEAGEASGTLDLVLVRLAEFTESQVKLKSKVKSAMLYPVIMMVVGSGLLSMIFIFVVPRIAKLLKSAKVEMPLPTKISIGISNFMQEYWWVILLVIFFGQFLIRKYISKGAGERGWHSLQLRLPQIGKLIRMINVSRFCSTLGTLLGAGVPILAALNIVKNLIPNVHMKESVEKSRLSVSEGASLSGPLIESGHFPPLVTHMIQLGENSGELEPMLAIIASNYEEQVENQLNNVTAMLGPLMTVLLGGIVGFVVLSVILPMLKMNQIR